MLLVPKSAGRPERRPRLASIETLRREPRAAFGLLLEESHTWTPQTSGRGIFHRATSSHLEARRARPRCHLHIAGTIASASRRRLGKPSPASPFCCWTPASLT